MKLLHALVVLLHIWSTSAKPPVGSTGFIPVKAESSSAQGEIFFWFIPPKDGNPRAPLILWLQGGPGGSGIQSGLLFIHGPVQLVDGRLVERNISWNNHFAMLYVDQPVGTGYSFTTNASDLATYASSEKDVAEMMHSFLLQFYDKELWPRSNPLFVTGESYGGHYCPAIASMIMSKGVLQNLHGVAIGDGLTDPETQVLTKPQAAYDFGLIDEHVLEEATVHARKASSLSVAGKYKEAKAQREAMEQLVQNVSGANLYDVRRFSDYNMSAEEAWLNSSGTKAMLGIPSGVNFGTADFVEDALADDFMRSVRDRVPGLLNLPRGVLFYTGQFDWKDGVVSNEAWLSKISWAGKANFSAAHRRPLHRQGLDGSSVTYGWGKTYDSDEGRLSWVTISGAGHMAPYDQPEAALTVLTEWIDGHSQRERSDTRVPQLNEMLDEEAVLI